MIVAVSVEPTLVIRFLQRFVCVVVCVCVCVCLQIVLYSAVCLSAVITVKYYWPPVGCCTFSTMLFAYKCTAWLCAASSTFRCYRISGYEETVSDILKVHSVMINLPLSNIQMTLQHAIHRLCYWVFKIISVCVISSALHCGLALSWCKRNVFLSGLILRMRCLSDRKVVQYLSEFTVDSLGRNSM